MAVHFRLGKLCISKKKYDLFVHKLFSFQIAATDYGIVYEEVAESNLGKYIYAAKG